MQHKYKMFRRDQSAKRFDPNALVLSQLQTLKERLITVLGEFLSATSISTEFRTTTLGKIDAIQNEITAIAVKLAIH